ncbi:radical SAM protein [Enterococcus hulanensis]|uniref:radical SAM/SPASM domain-containing protein n=1 Tax=Enterococcus hulanensis TaxID=2559929 RepID=UPI00288F20BF|nr:radical SAM protein [Enterococcus hulanensis]MDT2661133.1 radical SAM protein [Enterococcus hulanensis]
MDSGMNFPLPSKLVSPFAIGVEVTPKCNLRCSYCSVGYNYDNNPMKIEDLRKIFKDCLDSNIKLIDITGGEPFIRNDIIEVLKSIDSSIVFTIKTNGTLIDDQLAFELSKFSNLRGIGISIDSSNAKINELTRGKGVLERALNGIKSLNKYGVQFGLMTTVNRYNYKVLPELLELAKKIGAQTITYNRPIYVGKGSSSESFLFNGNELREIAHLLDDLERKNFNKVDIGEWKLLAELDLLRKEIDGNSFNSRVQVENGCTLGFSNLFIKYNGDVTACPFLEEPICGNVYKENIMHIWNNSKALNQLRERSYIPISNVCVTECKYREICAPGCGVQTSRTGETTDSFFCLNN